MLSGRLILCISNQADTGKKEDNAQNQKYDRQTDALTSGPATGEADSGKNKSDYP
jgi:hypothetical protein